MVSLNIYKNSANKFGRKTGFKIKNEIEDQDQSIPQLIGILTQVFCTFDPNLVILVWIGDELSCRQAQNGVTFDFEVKFDLEGQGQSPPKTIGILTKVFYTYGPNLVILVWTGDELSRGQASDYRTDGRTHIQTQATTIPEGQNWPRVEITASNVTRVFGWRHPYTARYISPLGAPASATDNALLHSPSLVALGLLLVWQTSGVRHCL